MSLGDKLLGAGLRYTLQHAPVTSPAPVEAPTAAAWPPSAEVDGECWQLGSGPADADAAWQAASNGTWDPPAIPGEPGLPLTDWIEAQASWYRSLATDAADLVADALTELARTVRLTRAATVIEYLDRAEVLDRNDD
jgi:hypothetical protein